MIDCILVQRRIESIEKLENVIKKLELFHIKAVFILAENAVAYLTESKVDIVISDIVLADSAGIDFMHRARGLQRSLQFIFLAPTGDSAAMCYDQGVFDHIVWPCAIDRIVKSLMRYADFEKNKVKSRINMQDVIRIREKNITFLVPHHEIYFVEGQGEYIRIQTEQRSYLSMGTLKNMLLILPEDRFFRIHKSYIVNTQFIYGIASDKIILKGSKHEIPIGVTYRPATFERFKVKENDKVKMLPNICHSEQ